MSFVRSGATALLVVTVSGAAAGSARAAVLADYRFDNPSSPPLTPAQRVVSGDSDPNSSASSFVGSSALGDRAKPAPSGADFVIYADGAGSSFDSNHYIGFTLDITAGYTADLTTLNFTQAAGIGSSSDSTSFTVYADVRSSLDNFASSLLLTSATRATPGGSTSASPAPSVNLSSFTGISGSIEFRFFVYDSTSSTSDVQRIDTVILSGNIVPEPAGLSLAGVAGAGLMARRRRSVGPG